MICTEQMPFMKQLKAFKSAADMKEYLMCRFWKPDRCLPHSVVVIGASSLGLHIIDMLKRRGIHVYGIFDDDPVKQGMSVKGIAAKPVQDIVNIARDIPVILATHRIFGLQRELRIKNFSYIWPFPILSFLDPKVFASHMFYDGMLEDLFNNRAVLMDTAMMLSDEKSRCVLDRVIGFRLTLDAEILADIMDPNPYFCDNVLDFGSEEVMIDGGSFDGDSIRAFINKSSNKFKKIIAFEPSSRPFEILKNSLKDDARIRFVQACLFERDTILFFDDSGKRSSSLAVKGKGRKCEAFAIDSLSEAKEITFIKMNIEGAEYKALLGAKRTIKKHHPKLSIAAYHHPKDLWSIPLLIKELRADYKLYLRQHDGGGIETVFYAKKESDINRDK